MKHLFRRILQSVALAASFGLAVGTMPAQSEDIDIFLTNPAVASQRPNVLIILDNTANWNSAFTNEIAALVSAVNGLDDRFNVGLMLMPETGSPNDSIDGGYVRAAVRQMTTDNKNRLKNLVSNLNIAYDKGNNATYGLAMHEAYLYFAGGTAYSGFGKAKRDYASNSLPTTGNQSNNNPGLAFSNLVWASAGNAFTSSGSSTYVSPVSDACQKSFIIVISNGPANDNASGTSTATSKLSALGGNTTTISLTPNGSESNIADEWARYMANNDVNTTHAGVQNVVTYTVDVDPGSNNSNLAHTALLKSMSTQGKGKYFAVTSAGGASSIVTALSTIFQEVLAVNSVFASSTLPVSINVRGTFLNQVYMGVFRPDGEKSSRWTGNVKQYKIGLNSAGVPLMVDKNNNAVESAATGFAAPTAVSFWTTTPATPFWTASYYPDAQGVGGTSDSPDGDLVEKGGAAQRLRDDYRSDLTTRKIYSCTGSACVNGVDLTAAGMRFDTGNADITATALGISGTYTVATLTHDPIVSTTGSTITATATITGGHTFTTNQSITISGANETAYNGVYPISVSGNTFKYSMSLSPATPATGTITATKPGVSTNITSITRSGTTATVTLAAALGTLANGQSYTIANATQSQYNGTYVIAGVNVGKTSFTYTITESPGTSGGTAGTAVVGGTSKNIDSWTRTSGSTTVQIVTTANHGFTTGASVTIAGTTGVNGTYTLTNSGVSGTPTARRFLITLASVAPVSPATTTGTMTSSIAATVNSVNSIVRAGTTATVTTSAAHSYTTGDAITITGAGQSEYNGVMTIANATGSTFTFTVAVTPPTPATGVISATASGTTSREELILWARGENRKLDDNPTATNSLVRGYLHGDVLHSRPAVVNYNRAGQPAERDIGLFYGANDGMIHAVKGGQTDADGYEMWSFVPPEFFSKFARLYSELPVISSSTPKEYFADGPISVHTINQTPTDGALDSANGDKVYLYIGMRRGGRLLYSLDVSDMLVPKLNWRISNATTGFAELGQTWSAPKVAKIRANTNQVLIFGAGYDAAANDVLPRGTATMGRGIYVVDAVTGDLIWHAGPVAPSPAPTHAAYRGFTLVSGMNFAIPADPAVIDSDSDTYMDRVYLTDTGGNIWRINIDDATPSNWTVSKLASLGGTGANERKFLFAPDIVPFSTNFDSVLVGSGDRERPFDTTVANRYYMIKDAHGKFATQSTAYAESDLCDLTGSPLQGTDTTAKTDATTCLASTSKFGWLMKYDLAGEKTVTGATTLGGTVYFGTNAPQNSATTTGQCTGGLGEARLYGVSFKDATATTNFNASGVMNKANLFTVRAGGGFPPTPIAISVVIDGKTVQAAGSGTTILQSPAATIGTRSSVFWSINADN